MNQHLKQAIAAARAGKEAQAKVLLARVVKEEPDNVNAWFLLSSLADTDEQKVQHLEKVLELQPGHAAASQQLAELAPAIPETTEDLPILDEPEADASPEIFPLPEIDLADEDTIPEDPDEAMAWLERRAADQGAPMDELPSLGEPEADETADTLFATPDSDLPDDLEEFDLGEYDLGEYEEEDTAPEDPDEAMAWLERLAADQGAPMDELPSLGESEADETADTLFATTDFNLPDDLEELDLGEYDLGEYEEEDTAPEDPDDAMAWLERLAAEQGAPLDELPSLSDEDDDSKTADALFAELTADFDEDYDEEETDDDMTWIENLAVDQDTPMDELPNLLEEDAVDDLTDEDYSWIEEEDEDDSSYLESLPTLVNEEEELEEDMEEDEAALAKTLTVSNDPLDIISQAEGNTIPSWLADDEDIISADTLVTASTEQEEQPAEPVNLPDWLNEVPAEEWSGDEGEKSGQVVWKAGEGDDSKKPEPPASKKDSRPTRQTAKAKDNTNTQLAILIVLAIILVIAILYLLIVQPL